MQRRLGLDLEIPDDFGYWLAGLTDGEGCFFAKIYVREGFPRLHTRFLLNLRADDITVLEEIRSTLGIGRIGHVRPRAKGKNPQVRYIVTRTADLYHVIIPLFEAYPLRSKKVKDFDIWKQIVSIHYHEGQPRRLGHAPGGRALGLAPIPSAHWDKIEPLLEQLEKAREYTDLT